MGGWRVVRWWVGRWWVVRKVESLSHARNFFAYIHNFDLPLIFQNQPHRMSTMPVNNNVTDHTTVTDSGHDNEVAGIMKTEAEARVNSVDKEFRDYAKCTYWEDVQSAVQDRYDEFVRDCGKIGCSPPPEDAYPKNVMDRYRACLAKNGHYHPSRDGGVCPPLGSTYIQPSWSPQSPPYVPPGSSPPPPLPASPTCDDAQTDDPQTDDAQYHVWVFRHPLSRPKRNGEYSPRGTRQDACEFLEERNPKRRRLEDPPSSPPSPLPPSPTFDPCI